MTVNRYKLVPMLQNKASLGNPRIIKIKFTNTVLDIVDLNSEYFTGI